MVLEASSQRGLGSDGTSRECGREPVRTFLVPNRQSPSEDESKEERRGGTRHPRHPLSRLTIPLCRVKPYSSSGPTSDGRRIGGLGPRLLPWLGASRSSSVWMMDSASLA